MIQGDSVTETHQGILKLRVSSLIALLFVAAAASAGCSEKMGSAFAPSAVEGVVGGGQLQFHDADTTSTATQGIASGGKKARWDALPESEKAARKARMAQRKARWDALPESEKAARKARMAQRKSRWDALSESEKATKRAARKQRKARWDALSESEKAAKRAERKTRVRIAK
ncbi:uncharacterized protein METZ01_LOCUS13670 [marine metagenome]|uniref:Uncharacterized protein n=1 Tax=marine metagenome TaxID=408172 RepID=A0A381P1K4_9ZZZZ